MTDDRGADRVDVLASDLVQRSRDSLRSRRARQQRATTVNMAHFSKEALTLGTSLMPYPEGEWARRPATRSDCLQGGHNAQRPCPFVSCRHHLYLDVTHGGTSIKYNFPDLEPGEMRHSCALDVADLGGRTIQRVAEAINITRERIRQVEERIFREIAPPMRACVDSDE